MLGALGTYGYNQLNMDAQNNIQTQHMKTYEETEDKEFRFLNNNL